MRFKLFLETDLPFAKATEYGVTFETGRPVTFKYMRGKEKAPFYGSRFMQDIEPAGRYMIHNPNPGEGGWEVGEVTFSNPLVIEFNHKDYTSYDENNWKSVLVDHYGKTGKELSMAIRSDGYDAIVTTGQGNAFTREIVDLTMF